MRTAGIHTEVGVQLVGGSVDDELMDQATSPTA
jgi:hypothetical protein